MHELLVGDLGKDLHLRRAIVLETPQAFPELDIFAQKLAYVARSEVIMAKGDTDWQTIQPAPIEEDRRIEFQGRQVFEIGVDGQGDRSNWKRRLVPISIRAATRWHFARATRLYSCNGTVKLPLLTEQRNLGRLAEVEFPVIQVIGSARLFGRPSLITDLHRLGSYKIASLDGSGTMKGSIRTASTACF